MAQLFLTEVGKEAESVLAVGQVHRARAQRRHAQGRAEGADRPHRRGQAQVRRPARRVRRSSRRSAARRSLAPKDEPVARARPLHVHRGRGEGRQGHDRSQADVEARDRPAQDRVHGRRREAAGQDRFSRQDVGWRHLLRHEDHAPAHGPRERRGRRLRGHRHRDLDDGLTPGVPRVSDRRPTRAASGRRSRSGSTRRTRTASCSRRASRRARIRPRRSSARAPRSPFIGSTFLGAWALLGTEHAVPIDGSADVNTTLPGGIGTSKTTITVKRKPPS